MIQCINWKNILVLLLAASIVGCKNKPAKSNVIVKPKSADTIQNISVKKVNDKVDPNKITVYEFKTDSVTQRAYIRYLADSIIVFRLVSLNKNGQTICELSDTAKSPQDVGSYAMYEDEKTEGDGYGAKEYFYHKNGDRNNYTLDIGIDVTGKTRMSVDGPDSSKLVNKNCYFVSLGTLRRIAEN